MWHAVRSINSGDTIRVLAGTYRPDETPTVYNRHNVSVIAEGNVVIDGSSLSSGDDCIAIWEANNVTIQGFELKNAPRYGVSTGQSSGSIIRDCVVHNNGGSGVFTWNATGALVTSNDIYSNGFRSTGVYHGVYVARGCSDIVVENNRIHGNEEEGVHCNGNDYSINSNITVRNNILYENGGKAADFQNTHDSFCLNNVFYGNNTKGTGPAVLSLDSDDNDADGERAAAPLVR